ncbi:hypothetical protein [Limnofasciculus baicalensis]|nr:hypothetical protein [Limnofasciculus baicalensis]
MYFTRMFVSECFALPWGNDDVMICDRVIPINLPDDLRSRYPN